MSTACFIRSPHLHSIEERITINGEPISTKALDELAEDNKIHLEKAQKDSNGALTHFEALTALAFKHFQEQKVCLARSMAQTWDC